MSANANVIHSQPGPVRRPHLVSAELLDHLTARIGQPLRVRPPGMPPPRCRPMDWEWRERVSKQWWGSAFLGDPCHGEDPARRRSMRALLGLRDRLLAFGGWEACLPTIDEDIHHYEPRGQFWVTYGPQAVPVEVVRGAPCRCHGNCCRLWESVEADTPGRLHIATGYALTRDGMWRQHSWLVERGRGGRISVIETTLRRLAYFGYVMLKSEASEFVSNND